MTFFPDHVEHTIRQNSIVRHNYPVTLGEVNETLNPQLINYNTDNGSCSRLKTTVEASRLYGHK